MCKFYLTYPHTVLYQQTIMSSYDRPAVFRETIPSVVPCIAIILVKIPST